MPSTPAIYARYSSHNQDGGTSIEVQLEQCRAVAGAHAIEYIDRAVTGTTMDRPQFNRLMIDAAAGVFTVLYVHKFDRFGRDAESHRFVKMLEACGVRVVSVTEGEDPLVRGIQLVVAEDFSRKLSERCRLGKIKSFEQGVWQTGIVPFGYRRDDKEWGIVIESREAEAVRLAFSTYGTNSVSLMQVANKLMALGHRPRKAAYWSAGTMRAFLTLPLYRGVRRHRDVEVVDPSLRIVADDLWHRVNGLITSRKATQIVSPRTQAFTRLLYCAECGSVFSRSSSTYNGKKYPFRWGCEQRKSRGAAICPNRTFLVETNVLAKIAATFEPVFAQAGRIISEASAAARDQLKATTRCTDELRARLRAADSDIDRLVGLLTGNQIPDADAIAALSDRIGRSKRERDRLITEIAAAPRDGVALARIESEVMGLFERTRKSLKDPIVGSAINAVLHETIGPAEVAVDGSLSSLLARHQHRRKSREQAGSGAVIGSLFWHHWAA